MMSDHDPKNEPLAKFHRERMEHSRQSVLDAMKTIDAEMAERGYYSDPKDPDKPLRLSVQEVQRRAGVSDAYLRNVRHKDLKKIVQDWLQTHKNKSTTSKPDAVKARRDTIKFYERALSETAAEVSTLLEKNKYWNNK